MKNVRPILLLVDNRGRDAEGILLVYYWLREMGYPVMLCNKNNLIDKCYVFNPSVVAVSPAISMYSSFYGKFLNVLEKHAKIAVIPQEGAIPSREETIQFYSGELEGEVAYTKGISKIFLWGEQTRRWLEEKNVFSASQMMVTGTPRFDSLLLDSEGGQAEKAAGFAMSHAHINCYTYTGAGDSLMRTIDERKGFDDVWASILQDRHWEDLIWYHCAAFRCECELIERCVADLNSRVSIRPCPFEFVEGYDFLKKKYASLEVRNDHFLSEWVKRIYCMITYNSTAGISALVYNVPVISPLKLLGNRVLDHIPLELYTNPCFAKFFWCPQTRDEAVDMIQAARAGKLPSLPAGVKAESDSYLKDFYDMPRSQPSSRIIAKELAALAEEGTRELDPIMEKRALKKVYHAMHLLLKYPYHSAVNIKNRSFVSMQRYHFSSLHYLDFNKTKSVWRKLASKYQAEKTR